MPHVEALMRTAEVPWPKSLDDLMAYIRTQVDGPHDYGTCVYAMSLAATATFYYVARELGTTGFQSSCADLDILRRTRSLKGPFMLVDAEKLLYPQYDLRAQLEEAIAEWQTWAKTEAQKRLDDPKNANAHPDVRARWEALAAQPVVAHEGKQ